jgi:glycine dehydrogenase subunit 2
MDIDALRAAVDDSVAGLMLTAPNTLGLFEPRTKEIIDIIHGVDGLCYCDGANLNALLGQCRPGDIGFDIMHVNLHKTFSTPHGGGGPGAGPVGVCEKLAEYLPISVVCESKDGEYSLDYNRPKSIGFIAPFYGNFAIIVRALAYCLQLGGDGLKRVSENAVLNANYIREKLKDLYMLPCPQICKHECVFSADNQLAHGVHAIDIAKALIDRGYHPPTVYFPLTVHEAIMVEPTECESRETLDAFIEAMQEIAAQAQSSPESFAEMPTTTPVTRLDEATAARKPDLASLGKKA